MYSSPAIWLPTDCPSVTEGCCKFHPYYHFLHRSVKILLGIWGMRVWYKCEEACFPITTSTMFSWNIGLWRHTMGPWQACSEVPLSCIPPTFGCQGKSLLAISKAWQNDNNPAWDSRSSSNAKVTTREIIIFISFLQHKSSSRHSKWLRQSQNQGQIII